jgi:hypothetical protein
MALDIGGQARQLRDALEPLAGGVYVAPEAYAAYVALGFDGPIKGEDGAVRPEPKAYFTSRGACMGRVSGEVLDHLTVWGDAITAAGLVPPNGAPASAGGGPHFGTGLSIDTAADLYKAPS